MNRFLVGATAILAGTALYAQADSSYGYRDEQNLPRGYGRYHGFDREQSSRNQNRTSQTSSQRQVKEMNRASNLIGAEVRLRNDEKAGTVKDVVIDFDSGRVAYIVVNANEVLDGDRTHVAVPARVFRVSGEQRHVMIDADQSRLEQVRSFTQNNLPPIRSQTAQMSRWRGDSSSGYSSGFSDRERQQKASQPGDRHSSGSQSNQEADWYLYEWYVIDPSAIRERSYSSDSDRWGQHQSSSGVGGYGQGEYGSRAQAHPNRSQRDSRFGNEDWSNPRQDRQSSSWRNTDRDRGTGSSATYRSGRSNQDQSSNTSMRQFGGWLRDVDTENKSITVESQNQTLTFDLTDNARVRTGNDQGSELEDLQEGEWVDIRYRYRNGSNEAQRVWQE